MAAGAERLAARLAPVSLPVIKKTATEKTPADAGPSNVERKLSALDAVEAYCKAAKGCRRRTILSHFGEEFGVRIGTSSSSAAASASSSSSSKVAAPLRRSAARCCDACESPDRVANAAAELIARAAQQRPRQAGVWAGGSTETRELEQERRSVLGARKRVHGDKHDTGLVDGNDSYAAAHKSRSVYLPSLMPPPPRPSPFPLRLPLVLALAISLAANRGILSS